MTTGEDDMCNGWSNKETWLVELWFGDYFAELALEGVELNANDLQSIVEEMLEEQMPQTGLLADFVNDSLREVNWHELSEHHQVEEEEEYDGMGNRLDGMPA
jgi:hypothetical protein